MKLTQLFEKSPPDPDIENWIQANKNKFKKQYGDKANEVLYATAWKMFKEKNKR